MRKVLIFLGSFKKKITTHFSAVHESMNAISSWVLTNTLKGEYDMYNIFQQFMKV